MDELFRQYRPFLFFLGKFFFSYLLLTLVYRGFFLHLDNTVDFFTENVSLHSERLARFFGMDYSVQLDVFQYQVFYQGKYIARIIEGCNAISVIILFIAFVMAFSGKWKPTLIYVCVGSLLIYFFNISSV